MVEVTSLHWAHSKRSSTDGTCGGNVNFAAMLSENAIEAPEHTIWCGFLVLAQIGTALIDGFVNSKQEGILAERGDSKLSRSIEKALLVSFPKCTTCGDARGFHGFEVRNSDAAFLLRVFPPLFDSPIHGISIGSWRRARGCENDSGKQQRVGKVVDPLHLHTYARVG
jgi:hypothetical protein